MQKKTKLKFIGSGSNIIKTYLDETSLPQKYKDISKLNRKGVVYKISIKGINKIYIGSTFDFYERIGTHAKDGRSKMDDLHYDMRKKGSFVVSVLDIYDTIEEARKQEDYLIKEYQLNIVKKALGNRRFLESQEVIEEILKTKMYNEKII